MRADLINPPQQPALADLVSVDALGYECIEENSIDLAFLATGKGVRLPRTCLPEPCTASLTRPQLGDLIGREPTQQEWDDYYSRYADHCRAEVVPFSDDPRMYAGVLDDVTGFWAPLAASYPPNAPIRSVLPGRGIPPSFGLVDLGTSRGSSPLVAGPPPVPVPPIGGGGPDPEDPTGGPGATPPPGPDPDPEEPLTPVPLPGALIFALTGVLALVLRRRGGSGVV